MRVLLIALLAAISYAQTASYELTTAETNGCSIGSERGLEDENDCKTAANALGLTYKGDEDENGVPSGCYYWRIDDGVWWNTHESGKSHSAATPICKKAVEDTGDEDAGSTECPISSTHDGFYDYDLWDNKMPVHEFFLTKYDNTNAADCRQKCADDMLCHGFFTAPNDACGIMTHKVDSGYFATEDLPGARTYTTVCYLESGLPQWESIGRGHCAANSDDDLLATYDLSILQNKADVEYNGDTDACKTLCQNTDCCHGITIGYLGGSDVLRCFIHGGFDPSFESFTIPDNFEAIKGNNIENTEITTAIPTGVVVDCWKFNGKNSGMQPECLSGPAAADDDSDEGGEGYVCSNADSCVGCTHLTAYDEEVKVGHYDELSECQFVEAYNGCMAVGGFGDHFPCHVANSAAVEDTGDEDAGSTASSHGDPIIHTFKNECYDLNKDGLYVASSHADWNHDVHIGVYNDFIREIQITDDHHELLLSISNLNEVHGSWAYGLKQRTRMCKTFSWNECEFSFTQHELDAQIFKYTIQILFHNYLDAALKEGERGVHLDIYPEVYQKQLEDFNPQEYEGVYFENPLPHEMDYCPSNSPRYN